MLVATLRTRTSADRQVVLGRAALGVPAAQHVLDAGIGEVRVVRGVRPVHGGDVGHHLRAHVVVVVGGDLHGAGAFDQPGRVPDEGQAHLGGLERGGPVVGGLDQARRLRDGEAAIGQLRPRRSPGTAGRRAPSERGNRRAGGGHVGLLGTTRAPNDRRTPARATGPARHGKLRSTGRWPSCCSHATRPGSRHGQKKQAGLEERAAHQARLDAQLVGLPPLRQARPEARHARRIGGKVAAEKLRRGTLPRAAPRPGIRRATPAANRRATSALPVCAPMPAVPIEREEIERIAHHRVGPLGDQLALLEPADVERAPGAPEDADQDQHQARRISISRDARAAPRCASATG